MGEDNNSPNKRTTNMKVGEGYKTHMDDDHEVGKELLMVSGWFKIVAVEPGQFMNCKLYTIEKVRDAKPTDYKPVECNDRCSKCGSKSLRFGLDMTVRCYDCGHWS